jgi:hypothetical protein
LSLKGGSEAGDADEEEEAEEAGVSFGEDELAADAAAAAAGV